MVSDYPGSWPAILSSIGLRSQPAALSNIFVFRPGATGSPQWNERVKGGAILILEGESPIAEAFGFYPGSDRIRATSIEDSRIPKLPIIWQKALELPRFQVPGEARTFAKERWTAAPMMAGFRRGSGAVLWVAASPGEHGYERFPYILHALRDLGLTVPFQSSRLWAFFDSSYRLRVDVDYFAPRWRAAGIAALHVAAWHYFEPDAERDRYLRALIEACHRNGILVYAWLELPHVSERFWNEHPEWREKTALLQDAHLDWRKLMNLLNPDCARVVQIGIKDLINRFRWDGINLAELYFESLQGVAAPARFTPMNDDFRAVFRKSEGFDPLEILGPRKDPRSLRKVLDFRAELARQMQERWLADLAEIGRGELDLVLTHIDDRFDTRMRDSLGADSARVLPLLDRQEFTFLIEDPATIWHLGPQRYPEIAKRYATLTRHTERLGIDINVVERYQDVYPTKQQTGTELLQLVHHAAAAFSRVALYFENSILPPDVPLLSSAAAVVRSVERNGPKLVVHSVHGVGIPWSGPASVDGAAWPVANGSVVWLPAGAHAIEPASAPLQAYVLHFNGDLQSARVPAQGVIELAYKSSTAALAVLNRRPSRLKVDGAEARIDTPGPYTLRLPRGQHLVTITTQ